MILMLFNYDMEQLMEEYRLRSPRVGDNLSSYAIEFIIWECLGTEPPVSSVPGCDLWT